MAFDITTAKPVEEATGGFDITTARPDKEADLAADALITDPLSLIPGQDSPPVTPRETTIGEDIIGAGETALSVASGATTGAAQGIASFAQSLIEEAVKGNLGTAEAADRIEQETMKGFERGTFMPRTEAGQRQAQAVGEVAQQAMPAAGLAGEMAAMASAIKAGGMARPGTRLIDDAGQPTDVLKKSLNDDGLVFEGLTPEARAQIPKVARKGVIKSDVAGPTELALVEQIKAGGTENALAPFRVVKGRAVSDDLANDAIRQGFEPGFVQAAKVASPETKKGMQQITRMMERINADDNFALDNRPTDIPGKFFVKRVEFIRDKATKARSELNRLARTELHGKQINPRPLIEQLRKEFDDLLITEIVEDKNGIPKPNYKGSNISKDRTSQRIINDMMDLFFEEEPDAFRFHNLKKQLDVIIDFRKKSSTGLTDVGRNVLKSMRAKLNEAVRDVSPRYADVNDRLHKSLTAIDNIQDAAGPRVKIIGEGAPTALGQELRKIISNYRNREPLLAAIEGIDDVAASLGGNFPENVKQLSLFARNIEDRFGTVAKNSLQGVTTSAVKKAVTEGPKEGFKEKAFQIANEKFQKARGINDFNAFQAMKKLLERENN